MKSFISLSLFALATSVFAQGGSSSSAAAASSDVASSSNSVPASSASGSATPTGSSRTASSTASASQAPPAGPAPNNREISSSCAAFLTKLNSDAELNACLGPMLSASSAAAGATGAALTKALDGLCNAPGCSDTTIRTQLTNFKDACKQELTGSNPVDIVRQTYDTLYTVNPFRDAVCSKDGGEYCVAKLKASTQPAVTSAVAKAKGGLYGGAKAIGLPESQIVISETPNTDVWRSTSVANVFVLADLPSEALCTACTASILKAYSQFGTPHALGAAKSPLLGGQVDLWKAITGKCDSGFANDIFDVSVLAVQSTYSGATTTTAGFAGLALSFVAVLASAWFSL